MYEQPALYADTLDSFNRISAFLHSGLSWSNYLTTLPPITRKFYLNMLPTHSDYLETSHHRLPTISSLGGCSEQHPADIKTSQTLKRHRTSDHSESDPERHNPTQQPRDSPASSSSHPPHPAHGPAQIKGSPAEAAYDRPITGPRRRFPDEHKSTPHLSTSASDAAANRRADSIREWYCAHTTPIASHHSHKNPSASSSSSTHLPSNTSDTKDPAVQHPDDDHLRTQPPTHTPPPAEQRALTSVTSFGGYVYPQITSILKSHKYAPLSALYRLSASRKNDQHTLHNADTPPQPTTPSLHIKLLPPPVPAHYTPSAQHGLLSIHIRTTPTRRRRNPMVRRMYGPAQRRQPEHPRPTRSRLTQNPLTTAHGPRPTANLQ